MVRPRRYDDDEILEVARAVFLEHGPGASVQLVADALGLSQPALFKRFGTREALLVRALSPSVRLPWVERLFGGPDERPLPDQLCEIATGALAFFALNMGGMLTLRASGMDIERLMAQDHATSPLNVRAAVIAFFAAGMQRGLLRPVDPERLATVFIGALQARAVEAHLFGVSLDPDELAAHADAVIDLLWSGVRPDAREAS